MLVDAAGTLQQGSGKPLLLLRSLRVCNGHMGQPTRSGQLAQPSISAPFYEFNARATDGVSRVAGFAMNLRVVDGPLVYNGFVSWPSFLFLFHLLCSPLVSWSPRIITTKSYIGFVMYYACGA